MLQETFTSKLFGPGSLVAFDTSLMKVTARNGRKVVICSRARPKSSQQVLKLARIGGVRAVPVTY